MKRLNPLRHDDFKTIQNLLDNRKIKGRSELERYRVDIEERYRHYVDVLGQSCRMKEPLGISHELAMFMSGWYERKPGDLKIINRIRKEISPDVCPMCGGLGPSEVDHVMPRDSYPEYCFLTLNLVPACSCNKLKGTNYKGQFEGERILHPYYDDLLKDSLAWLRLSGDLCSPIIEVEVSQKYKNNPAVKYHVDTVVKRSNIINWAIKKWSAVTTRPKSVFPELDVVGKPRALVDMEQLILRASEYKEYEFGTPNNWYSMLYRGFVESEDVCDFIWKNIPDRRCQNSCNLC